MSLVSQEEYDKALLLIKKRMQYNKQYYQKRKQNKVEKEEAVKPCGRKPIEDLTPERALDILQKYKLKCKRQKKEPTKEELNSQITKLFSKLKEMMP